jgi:hypothetical protein
MPGLALRFLYIYHGMKINYRSNALAMAAGHTPAKPACGLHDYERNEKE